jgi:hypothetical protein
MTAPTLTFQTATAPTSLPARPPIDTRAHEAVPDVVVPVYNEQADLPGCVRRLHAHLTRITIADNASTDRTAIADLKGVARVLGGLASGRIPVARVRARFGRAPLAA